MITLEYGAILELGRKKTEELLPEERSVVANYQYCTETFNQIEDDGDVLLIAQEHSRCVEYYKSKLEENKEKGEK